MADQNTLTLKEIKLIKGILAGKSKRQAAFEAYDVKTLETASAIASETLAKPNVQAVLQAELTRQGMTMEKIVAPVVKALSATIRVKTDNGEIFDTKVDDLEMQLKGHDRAMKILNVNQKEEGMGNTINFIKNANFNSKDYVK